METEAAPSPYAKAIANSMRVRWDIEHDVIRGRGFDYGKPFMPPDLSRVDELPFLTPGDRRLLSQVQGRTYAYLLGLCERFIGAKAMDLGAAHALCNQEAVQALVRMTDDELKHQALFRRLGDLLEQGMPPGYEPTSDPDGVARLVLGKSDWAVLALILGLELSTLAHYRSSIHSHDGLCGLWKDVFLFHWKEEAQHAVLDELEFQREDARLSPAQRDRGVADLIALMGAMDGIVSAQAAADSRYFLANAGTIYSANQRREVDEAVLKAYRWQYLLSGVMEPHFQRLLFGAIDLADVTRISDALRPLMGAVVRRRATAPVG